MIVVKFVDWLSMLRVKKMKIFWYWTNKITEATGYLQAANPEK